MQVLVYDKATQTDVIRDVHKVPFTRVEVNYAGLKFSVDGELIDHTLIINNIMEGEYPITKEAYNSMLTDLNFKLAVHESVNVILYTNC